MVMRPVNHTLNPRDLMLSGLDGMTDTSKNAVTVQLKVEPGGNGWEHKAETGQPEGASNSSRDSDYSSETGTKPPSVDHTNCSSDDQRQSSPGKSVTPATISSLPKPTDSIEVPSKNTVVVRSGVSHCFGGWIYKAKAIHAEEVDGIFGRPRYTNFYTDVDLKVTEIEDQFNGWDTPSVKTREEAFAKLQSTLEETLNPLERAYPDLQIRYESFESDCKSDKPKT